jgi:hypothetical protein
MLNVLSPSDWPPKPLFAPPNAIHHLITDKKMPSRTARTLKDIGIQVTLVLGASL